MRTTTAEEMQAQVIELHPVQEEAAPRVHPVVRAFAGVLVAVELLVLVLVGYGMARAAIGRDCCSDPAPVASTAPAHLEPTVTMPPAAAALTAGRH